MLALSSNDSGLGLNVLKTGRKEAVIELGT
jgi:hypothetical protein